MRSLLVTCFGFLLLPLFIQANFFIAEEKECECPQFNQTLCSDSNLPLSWCRSSNPYITVLPFSDVTFLNITNCYGEACSFGMPAGADYLCDSDSPLADCKSVTKMSTVQVFTDLLAGNCTVPQDGSRNQYESCNRTQFIPANFDFPVLIEMIGTHTGKIIGTFVIPYAGLFFLGYNQAIGTIKQAYSSEVMHLDSITSPRNNALRSIALILSGSENELTFHLLDAKIWGPIFVDCFVMQANIVSEQMFISAQNPDVIFAAILMKNKNIYWIDVFIFDPHQDELEFCGENSRYHYLHYPLNVTDYYVGTDVYRSHPPLKITMSTHHANTTLLSSIDGSNNTSMVIVTRNILSINSRDVVQLFVLETSESPLPMNGTVIQFGRDAPPSSIFYQLHSNSKDRIASTAIMEEYFTRSNVGARSILLWLLVGLDKQDADINVISLNEFAKNVAFNASLASVTCGDFTDPGCRNEYPSCPFIDYGGEYLSQGWYSYSSGSCLTRQSYNLTSTGRIVDIQVRARPLPKEVNLLGVSSIYSVLENDVISSVCNAIYSTQCDITQPPSYCLAYQICASSMIDLFKNYTSNPDCILSLISQDSSVKGAMSSFLYSLVYVQRSDNNPYHDSVAIWGMQEKLCSSESLVINSMSHIEYVGNLISMHISKNSLHLQTVVSRKKLDLDGTTRLYEICNELQYNPSDKFLSSYADSCKELRANTFNPSGMNTTKVEGKPTFNDFVWFASSCPPSTLCPSFYEMDLRIGSPFGNAGYQASQNLFIPDGIYTLRSTESFLCEPGFFCKQGSRIQCPIGYICPYYGMVSAQACESSSNFNETCYHNFGSHLPGLTSPAPCGDGLICIVSYRPGLKLSCVPAPPGFAVSNDDKQIIPCREGDWCSLGRSITNSSASMEDLMCPKATFCSSSSVLEPVICNFTVEFASYCPAGSINQTGCLAGNYCENPYTEKECAQFRYCPAGTFAEEPCPQGYFCTTPARKTICPEGYYCPEGSVEPFSCPFLTYCPEGSSSKLRSASAVLILLAILIVPIILWHIFIKCRDKSRLERDALRNKGKGRATVAAVNEQYQPLHDDPRDLEHDPSVLIKQDFTADLKFTNLGLILSNKKQVLSGVNGSIKHGRCLAIMGPSGAGKSTFITALCGKASYGTTCGRIWVNDVETSLQNFRSVLGFVPQEDIMYRTLTVKENIIFSARTRLEASLSDNKIQEHVSVVLYQLGLHDIRHSIIGDEENRGISGGQRKRVNIGLELAAKPSILFLDEPTSGLDSASCLEVCTSLQRIAKSGVSVVAVIHQPRFSVFSLFDDLLLLGKGGKTVFFGPTVEALPYFSKLGFSCPPTENPADWFIDVTTGNVEPDMAIYPGGSVFDWSQLFDLWIKHEEEVKSTKNDEIMGSNSSLFTNKDNVTGASRKTPGILKQTWLFAQRGYVQQSRQWNTLMFDCLLVLVAGTFTGLIYTDKHYIGPQPEIIVQQCPKALLDEVPSVCRLPRNDPVSGQAIITSMSLGLCAVAGSLRVYGSERIQFWRENAAGTSTIAYFIAQQLAHLPTILVAPVFYLLIFFQLTGPLASFTSYYFLALSVYWCAAGLGYLVSIIAPPKAAQLAGVLTVLVSMMFSGTTPMLSVLKEILYGALYWPTYLSFVRWSTEWFVINELKEYTNIYDVNPGLALYSYSFDDQNECIYGVLLIGLAGRVLAYLALQFLNQDKRM